MRSLARRALRVVGLALCGGGLAAILFYGRAVARHDAIARDAARVEDLLFRELEIEARRLGARTDDPEAESILRARARHEAALFARALADGMEYLDPVIEARLLELLGGAFAGGRAAEPDLLANDPVIRRRLINKRALWEG